SVILEKGDTESFRTLLSYCCGQLPELFPVDVGIDCLLVVEQFPKQHALPITENREHNLPSMELGLWLSWLVFAARQPVGMARVVLVVDPGLISSDDRLEKVAAEDFRRWSRVQCGR